MLKLTSGKFFALMMVAGSMAASAAFADSTPVESRPVGERGQVEGRCRFRGTFSEEGKGGGGFEVNCRARLEFSKRDLHDDDLVSATSGEHSRARMRLECDDQEIYSDGMRVKAHHGNVLFSGYGDDAPSIFVKDIKINHGNDDDHHDRSWARLKFERWGYSYELNGSCRFEKENGNDMETSLN